MDPPQTMRAWVTTRLGTPRTSLTLQPAHPAPSPPTGADLLVRISHAAANPADVALMGLIPTFIPLLRRSPPTPGLDFSGTVCAAGPDAPADLASPGTRVCGALSVGLVAVGRGALAEYLLVPAGLVARVPDGLGMGPAAGLGVVGQTATLALREAGGGLVAGGRVLVNGASGGLGAMVVQLAKAGGAAVVVGVCSGANAAFVEGLGADETIDYTAHDPLPAYLAEKHGGDDRFDVVFDCVGDQALFESSPPFLQPAGKFVCLSGGKSQGVVPFVKNVLRPVFLGGTPRTFRILGLSPSGELMREVVRSYGAGKIKQVPIDSEYGMDEVLEAYDRVMSKRSRGKVIIRIGEEPGCVSDQDV